MKKLILIGSVLMIGLCPQAFACIKPGAFHYLLKPAEKDAVGGPVNGEVKCKITFKDTTDTSPITVRVEDTSDDTRNVIYIEIPGGYNGWVKSGTLIPITPSSGYTVKVGAVTSGGGCADLKNLGNYPIDIDCMKE